MKQVASTSRISFSVTKWQWLWFSISGLAVAASIVVIAIFGLNLGIDFTGGSLMQVEYPAEPASTQEITDQLAGIDILNPVVQSSNDNSMIIKMRFVNDDERQQVLSVLGEGVTELSFESIGPTIGNELRQKSIYAIVLVVIAIVMYVAFVFRKVSKGPVPAWTFGVSAIIALVHDIVITVGVFVVLSQFIPVEVNAMFITALLTILGFSVNDTIVVFDRIREALRRSKADTFAGVIDESIQQTIMRSLNTTTTTAVVLLTLFLFGGEAIRYFVFTLLVGIIVGTYSSIFLASPLLLVWKRLLKR